MESGRFRYSRGKIGSSAEVAGQRRFNPVSGIQLAKYLLLLPPAKIIIALIWASLHNRDAPAPSTCGESGRVSTGTGGAPAPERPAAVAKMDSFLWGSGDGGAAGAAAAQGLLSGASRLQ
ncbi:MAG: hypothetical protein KME26_22210 [Oscillatoria princeps RMCB-10]|nr:hypothetical protein [Oscillatoria princeps RMCB-10]